MSDRPPGELRLQFHDVRIRAEWQDWTFGANQAAARAAASEDLIALRRQYTELSEPDVLRLAGSWRSDTDSGPYFTFTAADASVHDPHAYAYVSAHNPDAYADARDNETYDVTNPTLLAVNATFVKALFHELTDQAPAALAALLDLWTEQRRHATYAGLRPTPVRPPRVTLLLPRDPSHWPPDSWPSLLALDLDAPHFDGALLHWNTNSALWSTSPADPNAPDL